MVYTRRHGGSAALARAALALLVLAPAAARLGAEDATGDSGIGLGENWIQTGTVRVTLRGHSVSVQIRAAAADDWRLLAEGGLIGLLATPELMAPYRKKYGGYYLFGREATVAGVKTELRAGCPVMTYRSSLEELWIDTEITILAGSALVSIAAPAKSSDALVPHWRQTFHQRWAADRWWMPAMTHLLHDDPGGGGCTVVSAVHARDSHKFPRFRKYCIAYRHGEERVWGFLWPALQGQVAGKRQIQFPPGAITSAYLDAPYILFAETVPGGADERGVDTVGTEWYGRMRVLLDDRRNTAGAAEE